MGIDYKILIISDTHGDYKLINNVISSELPFDYLIHCGDSEVNLKSALDHQESYELIAVRGNCDYMPLPEIVTKKIGFYNILVSHGHKQYVKDGYRQIGKLAKKEYADIVCCGHVHCPDIEMDEKNGILYINPGSLVDNRPYPRAGTYVILIISEDDLPKAELKEVKEH